MKDDFDRVFGKTKRVLVVMAHPDDCEVVCGATVARLTSIGKSVRLVVMTTGGKGMHDREDISEVDFSKERIAGQHKGAATLGIAPQESINIGIKDGELEASVESIEKIAFHIRSFRPDIIITHKPGEVINTFSPKVRWVNHRDHRNAAISTVDAAYPYSRDTGFFPQHLAQGLKPHYVGKFLFSDSYTDPNAVNIEVSGFLDKKKEALKAHKSALSDDEIDGYIEELHKSDGYFETFGYVDTD